jgi:Dipeptidyl aminopeptidases/acylaminoacyl-peptidases
MFYLPPNFDPTKKYPMIVYYYGGTMPTSRTFEGPYPGHVFASQGYVVYVVQPSGATGFGQKFSALHVNAWGKRTAEDIIEGTKQFVKEHPYVNDKKIGCIGASYGGFMTMYLQTQTDMFAAAVSHAGSVLSVVIGVKDIGVIHIVRGLVPIVILGIIQTYMLNRALCLVQIK